MNKIALIIITAGVAIAFGVILMGGSKGALSIDNVAVREGVQYITIDAKGGYSPVITSAEAGIPTKLIVKTEGTYDCSAALVIRDANFQEILPASGDTEIDLGVKNAGEKVEGTCGMGMYNFAINF